MVSKIFRSVVRHITPQTSPNTTMLRPKVSKYKTISTLITKMRRHLEITDLPSWYRLNRLKVSLLFTTRRPSITRASSVVNHTKMIAFYIVNRTIIPFKTCPLILIPSHDQVLVRHMSFSTLIVFNQYNPSSLSQ